MSYSIVTYLIGEGIQNIFKNKKMMFASLVIMCATMIIFGMFFAISQNINSAMESIENEQGIRVFLEDISEDEIKHIETQIKAINGVSTVTYISKEEALEMEKERLKTNAYVLIGYDEVFPASFVVYLADLTLSKDVQEEISKLDNIDEVVSKDKVVEAVIKIGKSIRIVTGIMSGFLIIFSVFIISNTIKLAVYSRRKEISIMKYVGATNGFIRWPFMVEGIILGLISGMISIVFVGLIYNFSSKNLINYASEIGSLTLLRFSDMFNLILIIYIVLGIGIGVIGSMLSMKKYLKV